MTYASSLARLSDVFASGQGIPLANRNYIVDGNWDFWVTGNAVAIAAGAFTRACATMYIMGPGAGGAATAQLSTAVGGEPPGMMTPVSTILAYNQTTASTGTVAGANAPLIVQNIENVRTLQGRSATFSVWLQSAAPMTIPGIRLYQNFGTGGSPSATVVADKTVNWSVSGVSALKRYSVRLDLPSIVGKTIGTNLDSYLQVGIWLPPGVTFQIYTAQWQIEQSSLNSSSDINGNGGAPTIFEYRGYGPELARVQRHYQTITDFLCGATSPAGVMGAYCDFVYPVRMRAVPAGSVATGSVSYVNSSGYTVQPAADKCRSSVTVAATGYGYGFGGIITLDARL